MISPGLNIANEQIERLVKFFNIVNETAQNAADEHVGMTKEEAEAVRASYAIRVHRAEDGGDDNEDPKVGGGCAIAMWNRSGVGSWRVWSSNGSFPISSGTSV